MRTFVNRIRCATVQAAALPAGRRPASGAAFAVVSFLAWSPAASGAESVAAVSNPGASTLVRGLTGSPTGTTPVSGANTWGIEYDPVADRLYWTDIDRGEIRSARTDGSDDRIEVSQPGGVLRGVRVDSRRRTLFWLDSKRDELRAAKLAAPAESIVLCAGFVRPNDLAIDPDEGTFFVADSGHDAVFRCREKSPGAVRIFDGADATGAWGVDVDPERDLVFVGCHDTGRIWRMDYDGNDRILVADTGRRVRGLRLDRSRNRLRFLDAEEGTLHEVSVAEGIVTDLVFAPLANPRDLVAHPVDDRDSDYLPDSWEDAFFGSPVAADPRRDDDGDGNDNTTEFHFGGNPTRPEGSPILSAGPQEAEPGDDPVYRFTFDARNASALAGVPVFSPDLATWMDVPDGALWFTAVSAPEPGFTRITVNIDSGALILGFPADRWFFDLDLRGN